MAKYWMARTNSPSMWAIGEGDIEVAHVHDRKLAIKITALLNAFGESLEPGEPTGEKATLYDRPRNGGSTRFRLVMKEGRTLYASNMHAAIMEAIRQGIAPDNITHVHEAD